MGCGNYSPRTRTFYFLQLLLLCRASNAIKDMGNRDSLRFFLGMPALLLYKSCRTVRGRGCFLQSLDIFVGAVAEMYAHFFLFVCPACRNCLASVCSSFLGNLEPADAHIFSLECCCGWTGQTAGFTALRHWVEMGEYIDLTRVQHCVAAYAA